jgi:CopA family copper-resistance protein
MSEISRRVLLQYGAAVGASAAVSSILPGCGRRPRVARPSPLPGVQDLFIDYADVDIGGRSGDAMAINGTIPGPLLRFREGQDVTLRVTNALADTSSIHWHGLIVPANMDGVPGVSFDGIPSGQSFTYRFKLVQYGTYWYHSHSALQEQSGVYGPLVIDPADRDPIESDREHVVMLSDWTFEDPHDIVPKLKKYPGYYNFQRRTLGTFVRDARDNGLWSTIGDRLSWARMRMDPADISDVTGATLEFLINGRVASSPWSGAVRRGERVRLRLINGAAATTFDVRVPGLSMTVVQADGQNVRPIEVDELRIAPAETYDVIVVPGGSDAYAIFAEPIDRSGVAAAMLTQRTGAIAKLPPRRERPLRSMMDMGMDHNMSAGGAHGGHAAAAAGSAAPKSGSVSPPASEQGAAARRGPSPARSHDGHAQPATPQASKQSAPAAPSATEHGEHKPAEPAPPTDHTGHSPPATPSTPPATASTPPPANGLAPPGSIPAPKAHGSDTHGPSNSMVPEMTRSRLSERGVGLEDAPHRVLVYSDLVALEPHDDQRPPDREIELHLTGNMERFMWTIDGKKLSESKLIPLKLGERVRMTLVNDTMMEHPMHLHGMWMVLENGKGQHIPRKHTILVKPAERLSYLVTVDNPGRWAFHCHILYHMEVGMFRVFEVTS